MKNILDSSILMVDDTKENLYVLERILLRHGFTRLFQAESGKEAIEIARTHHPDLILLDIHMPQMDGFMVCKIIKEDTETADIPVIFLTARYKDLEHKVHGLEIGGDDYITKPFVSQELVARVQVALRLKFTQDQLKNTNIELTQSQQELQNLAESLEEKVKSRTAQLMHSEEKYRLLIEKASDAIMLFEPDSTMILEINESGAELFGQAKNKIIGTYLKDYVAPEDFFRINEALPSILKGNKENFFGVIVMNKKGKELLTDLDLGSIIYSDTILIQAIFHDLTDRKHLQEQLMHNERLATVGALATGLAHEINNPISIIIGFTDELAEKIKPDEPYYEETKIINQEVLRLSTLVKDLLKFSKSNKANSNPIDIKELLKRTHSLIRSRLRHAKVTWMQNLPETLPIVYGDDGQLIQVLINVIINALDAMPDGGELMISSRMKGDYLELLISDNGQGIAPELLEKIFDAFFTTKDVKGTGLGLTISKQLMTENNGSLTIESEIGRGTTIILSLYTLPQ